MAISKTDLPFQYNYGTDKLRTFQDHISCLVAHSAHKHNALVEPTVGRKASALTPLPHNRQRRSPLQLALSCIMSPVLDVLHH
eukprot:5251990-Amphidinium_carterae.1